MRQSLLSRMSYGTTYYHANMVQNILRDRQGYLRNLNDFYGDGKYLDLLPPFQKRSLLHLFIEFCVSSSISEDIGNGAEEVEHLRPKDTDRFTQRIEERKPQFWLDNMLMTYGIPHDGLYKWLAEENIELASLDENDLSSYFETLVEIGTVEELTISVAKEVFFLLFLNRELLHTFNDMLANQVQDGADDDIPVEYRRFFKAPGVLKRVRIPRWAQRAVFFRDRGRCVFCHRDLTGLISRDSSEHYDHIIPLAQGGYNDVTNLQLLCPKCNLRKSGRPVGTSDHQEMWY